MNVLANDELLKTLKYGIKLRLYSKELHSIKKLTKSGSIVNLYVIMNT